MLSMLQAEALYADQDGGVMRTGDLSLPARGDVCVRRSGRVVELARIESPHRLSFEAFRFVWNDALQVALHPFGWDECALCIPEPMLAIDSKPLVDWFEEAVCVHEASGTPERLVGAAHSMTALRESNDGVRFEVDFGSASVAAFETLLTALMETGAGLVVIGDVQTTATQG